MKKTTYYTLENLDGHVYMGCSTKRIAKKLAQELSNEGICYKRVVGSNKVKFQFLW